jgi:hypothetical protein
MRTPIMSFKRTNLAQRCMFVAVSVAVVAAASLLAGCSTSSGPSLPSDDDAHYFVRSAPDSVMANIRLAYEHRNVDEYLACLAEDFTFYPSERTLMENEWIPESWGKFSEMTIHENMFTTGYVIDVALWLLQQGDPVEVPGPNPGDPVSYEYTFGVDLRVDCPEDVQYVATAPSLFALRVDQEYLNATGDTLWEVFQWYDLDEEDCARPVLPTSWGELKALFLHID